MSLGNFGNLANKGFWRCNTRSSKNSRVGNLLFRSSLFRSSLFRSHLSLKKATVHERIALNKRQNDKRTSVSKSLSVSLKKSDISDLFMIQANRLKKVASDLLEKNVFSYILSG